MPYSTCESELRNRGVSLSRWIAHLSGSLILMAISSAAAPSGAAEWMLTPRLSLTGGSESDLIVDPNVDGAVVDAGAFANLRHELDATRRLGSAARVRFRSQGGIERYSNADGRWIVAQSLRGELVHSRDHGVRSRFFVSTDFFDDSQRTTVRRMGGDVGGGVGWVRRNWAVEATTSLRGNRYPHLSTEDSAGVLGTYSETTWVVGVNASLSWRRWLLRPEISRQTTDARDPLFDSDSMVFTLRSRVSLGRRAALVGSAIRQVRDFTRRDPAADRDEYLQAGVGMDIFLDSRTVLLSRLSFVRYTRTTGEDEDTTRFELGLSRGFGGGSPVPVVTQTHSYDPRRVRVRAPGAEKVYLVGDFNGWDPTATALRATGNGWWEVRLALPPGVYQYQLVVDGEWRVPPDARRVADGFGGENAILEIPAESL